MLDLRGRLTSWKTNLEGIGALLVPYLVSQGYWPQDRQQWAGWLGAGAIAVWKILSKDQKANGGRPGANGGHSGDIPRRVWPDEDKPTVRSPHFSADKLVNAYPERTDRRGIEQWSGKTLLAILLSCSLALSGCGKVRITLAELGPSIIVAINAADVALEGVRSNLDNSKYLEIKGRIATARDRAQELDREIKALGEITPGNVGQIARAVGSLTQFLQRILADAGLASGSKVVKILDYAILALNVAAGVLAAIHPPSVVKANRNTGLARKNPKPDDVNIQVAAPDREVREALEAAGKRTYTKPSRYEPGISPTVNTN